APDAGRRDTRAAASAARTGAVLARLYDRAGRADDAQGLPCAIRSGRGSGQDAIPDPSAHAAAWLRLCPSQRWPRHAGATGSARAQEHPTHRSVHRAVAASVQGLLALIDRRSKASIMTPGVGIRSGWDPQELMVWARPSLSALLLACAQARTHALAANGVRGARAPAISQNGFMECPEFNEVTARTKR